ncbi:cellulose binding domain-containing protein [Actinomadura fulvescens]|uniref:non-specific serine/threonine protein kinase n=1 Tax=Actinomadura fulvescens TaxID=46160 RepID=A0ABP6BWW8_9ACTN
MLISGQTLGERYRLVAPLGSGGMATVWRADDVVLERAVAVKVPREGWPEEFTRRLRLEAKAAARLAHPNITGVYDYGEEGGLPYVVMELLDGGSLAARLAAGPLPWPEAAAVGAQLADALAAAHALGVVHRDVKPANVFLTPTGVKVLDFGIAFTASARHDGPLLGTPAFVAPELRTGADPTPSADVYSLGVTLMAALTGEPAGTTTDARPLDVPARITDLLTGCLADDPRKRPTAAEVAAQLRRAAGLPVAETPRGRDGAEAPAPPLDPPTKVLAGPAARRRPVLIACGAVAALGLSALVVGLLQTGAGRTGATPRTPSPSTSAAGSTSCAVAYAVTGQWPGGFQADVRITNLGTSAIDGWRLTWTFPGDQRITQLWNGAQVQHGAEVTVTAADWNRRLGPNGTAQFGFLGRAGDGDRGGRPDRFTLNGTDCGLG